MTITGQSTPHISAYFNKGIVAAQWVSRALNNTPSKAAITPLVQKPGTPIRNALSGLLRPEILSLLADTLKNKGQIYAALYELNDPELIPALEAFGKNCNLILANGAFKPPTNDENAKVRAELKPKVSVTDRMVTSGHFAHNKFVVFCDSNGKPQQVLTGSTNWTFFRPVHASQQRIDHRRPRCGPGLSGCLASPKGRGQWLSAEFDPG